MKTLKTNLFAFISVIFLFQINVSNIYAQNLPNIQKNSVNIPANMKIDGNLSEWNNVLQAYNHNIQAYYTIANDDANLYLAIQAKNPDIETKIIKGGITFTINHSEKKNDPNAVSIKFPIVLNAVKSNITQGIKEQLTLQNNSTAIDSLVTLLNKQLSTNVKYINVTGIKAIQDSMLSVFNTEGIKVSGKFDNKGVLTYEIVLPLALLGMNINSQVNFSYNIKLNGFSLYDGPVYVHQTNAGPVLVGTINGPRPTDNQRYQSITTDFWGQYTLTKM